MIASIAIATAIAVVLLMSLGMLGRAWDWSPFALVVSGAIVGVAYTVGTLILWAASSDDRP